MGRAHNLLIKLQHPRSRSRPEMCRYELQLWIQAHANEPASQPVCLKSGNGTRASVAGSGHRLGALGEYKAASTLRSPFRARPCRPRRPSIAEPLDQYSFETFLRL